MIIRLSDKLAKKIREADLPSAPPNPNPFADWTARLFTADRTQYILVSNTASLYSAVFYGKGITDDNRLIHSAIDSIRDMMEHDGLDETYKKYFAPETGQVVFAKASNRSVISSMNEMIFRAKWYLADDEMSPFDVALRLNETPTSYVKNDYPRDAFRLMAPELQRSETGDNVISFPEAPRRPKDR
ncbi:MAG: hypothetical protein A4E62_01304 [Syntrophorhabdus sp. PtaU1.Bin002]|nr:MAG: hypothetical protein A4E62_01304 [Syntrophorhabdus sp. PtaU1.Bin002]